ncbi:hypothetical protein [Streptomyces sp. NPDC093600]
MPDLQTEGRMADAVQVLAEFEDEFVLRADFHGIQGVLVAEQVATLD